MIDPGAAIRTPRLALISLTLEMVRATLQGKAVLAERLGLRVPDEWPGPDFEDILLLIEMELERDPERSVWERTIVHTADRILIGGIGCKGRPDHTGMVEIGYNIVPAYQRQGYASEAARGLVEWLWEQPDVRRITADCRPDNAGSIRVLEGLGMVRVASASDDALLHWELRRQQRSGATAGATGGLGTP